MLDFRVETFLTAAETLNFTKTAALLNITQPAVSQHIRYLEKEYDAKLFSQEGKKLSLTPEGIKLKDALITMKLDENHLKNDIRNLSQARPLRFGATMTVGEFMMPKVLINRLFTARSLDITMEVANTETLLAKLEKGSIDFAIVEGYFPKRGYDSIVYSRERYIPVCSRYSMYSKGKYSFADLAGSAIITRESGSGTREVLEHALIEHNMSFDDFHSVIEIGNMGAIKKMVAGDAGISFMYEVAALDEIAKKELCPIQLKDFDITHDICFIWRKNSIYSHEMESIYHSFI